MMVIVLWLFMASYSQQVSTFPATDAGIAACAQTAIVLKDGFEDKDHGWEKMPAYRLACVPTVIMPPAVMRGTAPRDGRDL